MRRTAVLIYLAIFIGEVVWTSLVPLVPTYSDRFDLSKLEAGVLLAAASLTILLASIPATMLSDRYGARAVTLVAVAGMAVADVGQAITMPLFFASNALYPVALMPRWVQAIAVVNPLGDEVNALRGLLLGTPAALGTDIGVLAFSAAAGITTAARLLPRLTR